MEVNHKYGTERSEEVRPVNNHEALSCCVFRAQLIQAAEDAVTLTDALLSKDITQNDGKEKRELDL